MAAINAASVSRALARAGHRALPSGTPRGREGIRVMRNGTGQVLVAVHYDNELAAARRAAELATDLRAAGYTVHMGSLANIMYVTRAVAA